MPCVCNGQGSLPASSSNRRNVVCGLLLTRTSGSRLLRAKKRPPGPFRTARNRSTVHPHTQRGNQQNPCPQSKKQREVQATKPLIMELPVGQLAARNDLKLTQPTAWETDVPRRWTRPGTAKWLQQGWATTKTERKQKGISPFSSRPFLPFNPI